VSAPAAVAGVVGGSDPAPAAEQTVPVVAWFGGAEIEQAIASGADWLWFLAAGAEPRPDALELLLDAARPPGEPPASIVAGMVLDRAGGMVETELPAPDHENAAAALRVLPGRLLPIRHASFAHCLVARATFDRHGLPDFRRHGALAPVAWTAAVLGSETGYFAPASVVTLDAPAWPPDRAAALAALPGTLRLIRSGAWTRGESARRLSQLLAVLARRS
jgi:hypothetical protein